VNFRIIFLYVTEINGVRQGGILLHFYFICFDELSLILQSKNIGCRLGNMIINHLLFADDAAVFAPSANGLQELLGLCSNFAISHNVVFNASKSQCLIVKSKYALISYPSFHLSEASFP